MSTVYEDTLGRPIDSAAEAFFSKLPLDNIDARAQVVHAVFESTEFLSDLIEHDYQTYLGRPADASALDALKAALANGLTEQQLVATIIGSAEFDSQV